MPAHRGSIFISRSERSLSEIWVNRSRMTAAVTRKEMRNRLTIFSRARTVISAIGIDDHSKK